MQLSVTASVLGADIFWIEICSLICENAYVFLSASSE